MPLRIRGGIFLTCNLIPEKSFYFFPLYVNNPSRIRLYCNHPIDYNIIIMKEFIVFSSLDAISYRFGVSAGNRLEWEGRMVVSAGKESLVLTCQKPKELVVSTFGMIPCWSKESRRWLFARGEGKKNPANEPHFTGSKAIFMNPAFRKPLFRQRCAVPADALVIWNRNQPWLVYLRDKQRPFAMAGVYDIWADPGTRAEHHSFALITVPGNGLIRQLSSDRMPVILPPGGETSWLRESCSLTEILSMLQMYPAEKMNAHPVSDAIFNADRITAGMLRPVADKALREHDLKQLPQRYYHSRPRLMGNFSKPSNTS